MQSPPERPVYLLGESFGGVLALAVAEARPDLVDRVVLVNPATSFSRSLWPALGPFLPRVPKVMPHVSILIRAFGTLQDLASQLVPSRGLVSPGR